MKKNFHIVFNSLSPETITYKHTGNTLKVFVFLLDPYSALDFTLSSIDYPEFSTTTYTGLNGTVNYTFDVPPKDYLLKITPKNFPTTLNISLDSN